MKNKLVIWGKNAQDEKVLIALELQAALNKVQLYTFPESITTDEFVDKMMQVWRSSATPVDFPEGFTHIERELSMTESLLPDDLKVDRPDIITRAQTEWHFSVLATKLNHAYKQELIDLQERVAQLSTYDAAMWDTLRAFWDKVQSQVRERNLWREHADEIKESINVLFENMKSLRTKVNEEFTGGSKKIYEDMTTALAAIEAKIATGTPKMNLVFDELKALQSKYREAKMTNEHRRKLWDRLDGAFKAAKERRFGPSANEGTVTDRHSQRLNGLNDAIKRMTENVRRDDEELAFQNKKIATSEGQLEAQIRKAKIKMVEERLISKKEKLAEMIATREEVERQVASSIEKEAKRVEKDKDRKKFEEAKEKAKADIKAMSTKLAAEPKKDSLFDAATTVLGEVFENAIDSIKAVSSVVGEKMEEAMERAEEKFEEAMEKAEEKMEEVMDVLTKKEEPATEKPAEAEAIVETPAATAAEEAPAPEAVVETTAATAVEEAPAPEAVVETPAPDNGSTVETTTADDSTEAIVASAIDASDEVKA